MQPCGSKESEIERCEQCVLTRVFVDLFERNACLSTLFGAVMQNHLPHQWSPYSRNFGVEKRATRRLVIDEPFEEEVNHLIRIAVFSSLVECKKSATYSEVA